MYCYIKYYSIQVKSKRFSLFRPMGETDNRIWNGEYKTHAIVRLLGTSGERYLVSAILVYVLANVIQFSP